MLVGCIVGLALGVDEGSKLGSNDGSVDGDNVGIVLGCPDGFNNVILIEGLRDGTSDDKQLGSFFPFGDFVLVIFDFGFFVLLPFFVSVFFVSLSFFFLVLRLRNELLLLVVVVLLRLHFFPFLSPILGIGVGALVVVPDFIFPLDFAFR